jgi:ribose 5-phosphate isomerase B
MLTGEEEKIEEEGFVGKVKVYLASDHAGYEYKAELLSYVESLGHEVTDAGAHTYNEEDDYPEFISNAAREVARNPKSVKAIILGGSGQGEAIMANRFKHVRAAVYNSKNPELIELARKHNDANILSIGARFVSLGDAKAAVMQFLDTPFSDEKRHIRRITQIEEYGS